MAVRSLIAVYLYIYVSGSPHSLLPVTDRQASYGVKFQDHYKQSGHSYE